MAASSMKLPVTKGKNIGGMDNDDDDNHETTGGKKPAAGRWGFVQFFFVLAVVLCVLLYAPRLLVLSPYGYSIDVGLFAPSSSTSSSSSAPPPLEQHVDVVAGGGGSVNAGDHANDDGHGREEDVPVPVQQVVLDNQVDSPCSSMRDHTICCDRSSVHTDVCFMSGDVRTDPTASLSLLLFPPPHHGNATSSTSSSSSEEEEETVRPYPRKWETFIMDKIPEVRLRRVPSRPSPSRRSCDVRHDAPLLVMSAGGYTGNLFHAFNDGFLPAWLTSQHLLPRGRGVVLGVVSYNPWWAGTFREVISGLSAHHPVIDLLHDTRTHCFPGAIVGTRYHGILVVDPAKLRDNKTVVDFHHMLAHAYANAAADEKNNIQNPPAPETKRPRPRLGIVSRKGTRVIENQAAVAALAKSVGFDVAILETSTSAAPPTMSAWYAALRACDGVVGVHGADLTRFLFMRPTSPSAWLTQIAPLGVSPIAREDFGVPARRMGLAYEQYEVGPHESSLARTYQAGDVVLADPEKAAREQGWDLVARVYLGGQNVTIDLDRFRGTLVRMHTHAMRQRRRRR